MIIIDKFFYYNVLEILETSVQTFFGFVVRINDAFERL